MELEELKSTWKEMSERLDKKEIFEKRLVKETISTRARNIVGKEHEKVFRTTILYLLIAFGLMPFLYYKGIMSLASIVAMDVYILIALGISLYIRSYIIGIDLSKSCASFGNFSKSKSRGLRRTRPITCSSSCLLCVSRT